MYSTIFATLVHAVVLLVLALLALLLLALLALLLVLARLLARVLARVEGQSFRVYLSQTQFEGLLALAAALIQAIGAWRLRRRGRL